MNPIKSRSKVTRIRRATPGLTIPKLAASIGLILVAFLTLIIIIQAGQYTRLKREASAHRVRLEQQEARNERVKEEIERLSDSEYIELLARKHLGLVKPGEIVFQLND
ncbi:MAG: septum formation initiator family protein [Firmicutes bacterium]|nr:septum formation initiator family protein [Bacillota bacterium]